MPLNSLSFCWICDLYASKRFSAPSMPFFSLYFLLRLLFICWPHYVIDRPRSLFNMPFICIIALLYPLYAFSWPHFLLILSFLWIIALWYFLYVFSWPHSLLNFPSVCIKALLYPLYPFSWLRLQFYMHHSSFVQLICLQLLAISIVFALHMH